MRYYVEVSEAEALELEATGFCGVVSGGSGGPINPNDSWVVAESAQLAAERRPARDAYKAELLQRAAERRG